MQRKTFTRIYQSALFVLCMGLGILLFIELNGNYSGFETNVAINLDEIESVAMENHNNELQLISEYQDTVNRPLFMQDRQPYVMVKPEIETTKVTVKKIIPQQFSLSAIVISYDKSLAILQYRENKTLQRIVLGETIDGWTLAEIHDQYIVLKKGDEMQTLELEIKGSPQKQSTN